MHFALFLFALFFLDNEVHAGRFSHVHKKEPQVDRKTSEEYKPPEPQLVNSAKRHPDRKAEPVVTHVQTPFIAHALEMKNHRAAPRSIRVK